MSQENEGIGYDALEYSKVKAQAWRLWVEQWTLVHTFRTLGITFDGLRVGDFGSGTGLYSRMMIGFGAKRVLAIEGDRKMIEQARAESAAYDGLVTYEQSWIQDTTGIGDCQVALGSYLLSYPKSPEEAASYCRAIASHLPDGGVFVGFGNNTLERTGGDQYKAYGFTKVHSADTVGDSDGAWVDWRFVGLTDPIRNYNIYPETYRRAFADSGMKLFWQKALLHPSQEGDSKWNTFFEGEAPVIAMIATKGETDYDLSAWT